ncbi:MAG: radical SAM protein [Victivallales bacterium]|nr:radical SAM protein [Victivallales bacterium]
MSNNTIRINNMDFHGSTCDGPGIRNVVFFQGCSRHCPGCHNMGTWNPNSGHEIEISELVSIIDSRTPMRRITISGGEPLMQIDGLIELAKSLRQRNYDIAVYTGNRLDDVPQKLLDLIDYIKVGDYQKEYRTSVKPYVGSTNQEFIKLH